MASAVLAKIQILANVELPTVFLKTRIITFVLMTLLSLLGTTLLCVELSVRADVTNASQRNIVLLLILTNSVASVMFPAMLLFPFTVAWEGARLLCLALLQIGMSGIFTTWYMSFKCPDPVAACTRINMAILVSVWVIPSLLMGYSAALAGMVYRRWKHPEFQTVTVHEKHESELPMMSPPLEQLYIRSSALGSLLDQVGLSSKAPGLHTIPEGPDPEKRQSSQSAKSTSSGSSRSSGKLSKGKSEWFY